LGRTQSISLRERRRADELARRRADAVAVAASVFAAKGYHDAQMTEIAARAELSRASLYAMFESKQELFQEVISTTGHAIGDAVRSRAAQVEDAAQRVLAVIDSLFACYEANQDLLRIYALGTQGVPFSIRRAMGEPTVRLFAEFTDWVVDLSRQAQRAGYLRDLDPEAFGVALVGTVTTTAARWVETSSPRSLSEGAPAVRALFERLLGAETGAC
jgi:AcrR family transcriptional regulator